MFTCRLTCRAVRLAAMLAPALALGGCPIAADFADTFPVTLPGDRVLSAERGDGAAALANTTWAFFKAPNGRNFDDQPGPYGGILGSALFETPADDEFLFRAEFGADGRLVRIFDNNFLIPEIVGDEFLYDEQSHSTNVPLLLYVGASYGIQDGNQVGYAAPYDATFAGVDAASALAYAWATLDGDRMTGVIGYLIDPVDLEALFGDSIATQWSAYAIRE
ncbi:MAG: hypothetical protein CHACPFDD_02601 [Phycisphaerae bacterium]|nr:hypothetical protein [Phycisphaerae bacterium]